MIQVEPAQAAADRSVGAVRRVVLLSATAAVLYAALGAVAGYGDVPLPESVRVGVPFLAVPVVYLWRARLPLVLGKLDRTLLLSAAAYAPFALWIVGAAPSSTSFFHSLANSVATAPLVAWWAVDTFFHVGAVDFFTKRVVQEETESVWGPKRALLIQWAAWSAGHVVEWLWLRFILGDGGAAAFLTLSGLVTGLAYMRWKNVGGLMVGHFLVNVAAAAVAVAYYA